MIDADELRKGFEAGRAEQIAKLSQWVQNLILGQLRQIQELKDQVVTALHEDEKTDCYFEEYPEPGRSNDTRRVYMPTNRGRVFIEIGKGRYNRPDHMEMRREDRYGKGGVYISGDNRLYLTMDAANALWVTSHPIIKGED